jgi:long-chain acyl-CoA synthetase
MVMQETAGTLNAALVSWPAEKDAQAALRLLEAAESLLLPGEGGRVAPATWHAYLDVTADPTFLQALPGAAARERWASTTFRAIRVSGYSLRTMLEQRARAHGDRVFLEDRREPDTPFWSYSEVRRYARAMAGVFLDAAPEPRVAIFCENNVDGVVADLACLTEGILVTPLNVHLDEESLAWIFRRLAINIVVTDTGERHAKLARACDAAGCRVTVFLTGSRTDMREPGGGATTVREAVPLRQACVQLDLTTLDAKLAARRTDVIAPATVMFTSGSTGGVKGVVFSQYMLLTKRFARAAALPAVGHDEVLLCYLPLFHTFGRYLEMLGMLYWRGRYVFAGNPSAEALVAELGRVRPTGLISVPVRWTQVREHCLEALDRTHERGVETHSVRQVVGDRLRWGLSAAGYLDPQVFRFFQRHGVDLCSGFGMTEATGGITMTPPGAYVDNTVGVPLPGIDARLGGDGELQISGAYVASYLDEDGAPGTLPGLDPDAERWVATGDLFRRHDNGYYEIVDRIKDIYKNSRGQTIAPQRVEQRFANVPGVRSTFLAGDHRDYNVLLIVPDRADPLLSARGDDEVHEYFAQIVASANAGLAPYERVVNFALLERDFDVEHGELTPKGSFRRKAIEANFADVIERLYRSNHVELAVGSLRVRIPRWFFRDLGILEDDITAGDSFIENRRAGTRLDLAREGDTVRAGDLEYEVAGDVIDLGLFTRQPRLWLGNAALVAFSPCRAGWDVALRDVSERVRIPRGRTRGEARRKARDEARGRADAEVAKPAKVEDERLRAVHAFAVTALHGAESDASHAIERLGEELARADVRLGSAIRRRLEALAFHREEAIRALAYRTLLLDIPLIDYDTVFPAFLESGLSFLTEESIAVIAQARPGERRLQSLRQRLYSYRVNMQWPGPPMRRRQLRRVFRMLADFARRNRDDYAAVQAEFAVWSLFRRDTVLARTAQRHLDELTRWHEQRLRSTASATAAPGREPPTGRVVFEFGIPAAERARLEAVLFDPTFLRHSITHAFGEDAFAWERVAWGGAWVSPLPSHHHLRLYRVGINLVDGHHFDVLLITGAALRRRAVKDTMLWLMALSGHALGTPALPRFGAWRRDLGAATLEYLSDLTAWERIREIAGHRDAPDRSATENALRKLYVRSMAAFFRAWEQSGYRIVPGAVTPSNVALPEADFQEGTSILSLAGWCACDGPLALVRPMVRNFYQLTSAHYPQMRENLQLAWIFDAAMEALGPATAERLLDSLAHALEAALARGEAAAENENLLRVLKQYRKALEAHEHLPLAVFSAVDRYRGWERLNAAASAEAREDAVMQMTRLYRLDRLADTFRYHVYRHTYFATADDAVHGAFERLIDRSRRTPEALTGYLEELSLLQAQLRDPADRAVFSRMVFPQARRTQKLELHAIEMADRKRVIVQSEVRDDSGGAYVVRDPMSAVEVGHLYRLILEAGYRIHITAHDRQLVIVDAEERIVGGLVYRLEEEGVVAIDAIVVARSLTHQGLGGRLLEDFCVRMAAQGARLVRTNFFLGGLFAKHGFQVNERWGGLVRFLAPPP